MSSSHLSTQQQIPNKIHYIWLGSLLPQKYLTHLMTVHAAAQHSHYELNLWVDNVTNFDKAWVKSNFSDYIKKDQLRVNIRNVKELQKELFSDERNPKAKANRIRQFNSIIERESVGYKNLAAVSDLLRLEILRQEGGIYIDTDLCPHLHDSNKPSLLIEPSLSYLTSKHGFLFVAANVSRKEIRDGGNCFMAAIKDHEILHICIDRILERYKNLDDRMPDQASSIAPTFFDVKRNPILSEKPELSQHGRLNATLHTSGPGIILSTVVDYAEINQYELRDFVIKAEFDTKSKKSFVNVGNLAFEIYYDNTWFDYCVMLFSKKEVLESTSAAEQNTYKIVKSANNPWRIIYIDMNNKIHDISEKFATILPSPEIPFEAIVGTQLGMLQVCLLRDGIRAYHARVNNEFSFDDESNRVSSPVNRRS